jgi:hypothetical protein
VTADTERTWQLVMSGHGLGHITAQAQADMARLLDLMPSITHLTIETRADTIHVARDWPSDRMEEADSLIDRIARSDGITAVVVHETDDDPPRRIAHD